jgi:hypothetical protein
MESLNIQNAIASQAKHDLLFLVSNPDFQLDEKRRGVF